MNNHTILQKSLTGLCVATTVVAVSCVNDVRDWVPTTPEEIAADINKRFDFDSWASSKLTVDAGTPAYVTIYDGDPALSSKVHAVRAFPTDSQGHFECDLELGQSLMGKDFYAVTESGLTMRATYTERGLRFTTPGASRDGGTYTYDENAPVKDVCRRLREFYHQTFPEGSNQYRKIWNTLGFYYTLDDMGRITHADASRKNLIHTDGDTEITVNMIDFGEAWRSVEGGAFDGNGEYKAQLYYYYYADDMFQDRFNQPVYFAHTFISDKFRIAPDPADHPQGSRDVYVSDAYNTEANLGKEFRLKFYGPHDTEIAGGPRDLSGGATPGTDGRMQRFEDEGSPSYTFPAGYNIGFLLVMGDNTLVVNPDRTPPDYTDLNYDGKIVMILSDPKWGYKDVMGGSWYQEFEANPKPFGCVSFSGEDASNFLWPDDVSPNSIGGKRLFYTFEDNPDDKYYTDWWEDDTDMWDYNDFMFMVTVNATEPEEGFPTNTPSRAWRYGTYMFEDLYPDAGDYDMNDVMVEYYYMVQFDETTREIKQFDYSITPVHNGADYVNDFYLAHTRPGQAPTIHCVYRNNITVAKGTPITGSAWIDSGNALRSTDDFAASFIGMTYSDTDFWRQEAEIEGITTYFGIDPFIYVTAGSKNQVHLTKFQWQDIGKGAPASDNPYHRMYLVDTRPEEFNSVPFPFAIDMAQITDIPVPVESKPLWYAYDGFILWCGNGGTTNKDWFNHPK